MRRRVRYVSGRAGLVRLHFPAGSQEGLVRKSVNVCAGLLASALVASTASAAGVFSTRAVTGDADSQISAAKTYTHAVDLNSDDGGALINGVTFIAGTQTGANYSLTGVNSLFQNDGTNVTGGLGDLLDDF